MGMRRVFLTVFATVAVLIFFPAGARAACDPGVDLVISEFMAANDHTLTDEDGEYSDWIEVYNPCQPGVNLAGWSLTDDPSDLGKWLFPALTLDRGESVIVFASGKSRAVAGQPLHANFKLEVAGEYLALVRPGGTTIAQEFAPQFPPQVTDMSYGFEQSSSVLLSKGSTATYHVPAAGDASLGTGWTAASFDDAAWTSGPTGLGFIGGGSTGFDVTLYRARIPVTDLATAEAVIDDPATHLSVAHETASVVNYVNTGGGAHYGSDRTFPGMTIGTDINDFVVLATGDVIIPAAGPWTFGVNSDDGFGLELSRQPHFFSASFPQPRGPADSFATFDLPEAGRYHLRLVMYERGGGSEVELFAAPGSLASFTSAFRLVGDTAGGGLAVNGLVSEIGTDVGAVMRGVNASIWSRLDFQVADPSAVGLLVLRLEYEDGVVAYLNGHQVGMRNAPATVLWDSAASSDRPIASAAEFERLDLSDFTGLLQAGTNVLALHGLNDAAADPDFLVLPELTAVGAGFDTGAPRYFTTATPGALNTAPGYPAVSATPQFSRASTTFTTPFSLTLSSAAPMGVIRYTLDGTVPTATTGTVYTTPIAITDSARVTARVFEPGLAPSRIIGRLYGRLDSSVTSFSSNLPIVVVHTFGAAIAEDWLTPTLTSVIDTSAGGRAAITDTPDFVGPAGIRIRGSSSRSFPKKQFALETWDDDQKDKDVAMLDLPPESDWILYAPYSEKSLIQNVMAYGWYNATGRYAVRTRFCEMYLKTGTGPVTAADYAGIYVVMEKIKQGPARVNITELLPTDETPPSISGGYIFKKDRLDPGDSGFLTSTGQRLAYVDPKEAEITAAQAAWLKGYLDEFESVLSGPGYADPVDGYAKYIDVGSFIDHHILVELAKNIDGYRLSSFFFKDRLGKLNMGPVWDYNLSLGNANYLDGWLPTGWYYDLLGDGDYPYYRRLFSDPEFAQRYADRWFELRRGPFSNARLLGDFDGAIGLLQESAPRNFQKWPILGTYVWPNWYIGTTWPDDVAWTRQWLVDRLAWFDAQFPAPPTFSRPGGSVPIGTNLTITAATGAIYYTLDGSDPRLPGGAVSPAAIAYGGPLVLLQPTQVRARSRAGSVWSALNDATYDPVPIAVVNEILPVNLSTIADEHGDHDPWIEIYNPSATAVAPLGGMFLTDDAGIPDKWEIPAGTDLCAHERLLVWADGEPSEGALHAGFTLSPAAGTIYLFDAAGVLVNSLARPALSPNVSYGRQPDGGSTLVRFIHPTAATANQPNVTPLLMNEYNGVLPTRLLSGGASDPFWGRILGNGGDWFELVVVQDHLDLRGYRVLVRDKAGIAGDTQQTLVFTENALLSDMRSGTILTVAADLASDLSFDPSAGDFWINLRSGASGDGLYISALPFSVSNDNTQITLLDRDGVVVFGPAGEGINPASGVGNDEVLKLEADPGPGTTAASEFRDGSSSTFGAPNVWSGGAATQSFAALRAPLTFACSVDADCNDSNPCTDDACAAGHCANTPNTATCDDGNPCTDGDVCSGRVCRGATVGSCCLSGCACEDASVCTVDSCGPAGCRHAPACALSGAVRYYRDASSVEPSTKGVPGVGIDVNADGAADALTAAGGSYAANGGGSSLVAPLPWLGAPRAASHNGAISSFDASLVARSTVGTVAFSVNQAIAADVSGNGQVTSFDAARIAQFAAGLADHFDVALASGSDWRFLRCDTYDDAASHDCGAPLYTHNPLTGPETGDFYAVLYGDVSGNWQPGASLAPGAPGLEQGGPGESGDPGEAGGPGEAGDPEELAAARRDRDTAARLRGADRSRPERAPASGPAVLTIQADGGRLARGERRRLLVRIDNADGVEGLDLALVYPSKRLGILSVQPAGIGAGLSIATGDYNGVLRVGLYGLDPLQGSGTLLEITVEAFRPLPRLPELRLEGSANEGGIDLVPARSSSPPRSRGRG